MARETQDARQLLRDLATLSQRASRDGDAALVALTTRASRGDPGALIELRPELARVREERETSRKTSTPRKASSAPGSRARRGKLASPFDPGDRVVLRHRVAPFLVDEILTVSSVGNAGSKSKPSWLAHVTSARGVAGSVEASSLALASASLAERARASSPEDFARSLTGQERDEVDALAGSPRAFWDSSQPAGSADPTAREPTPREIERDVARIAKGG